jgi:O-antigen ligase
VAGEAVTRRGRMTLVSSVLLVAYCCVLAALSVAIASDRTALALTAAALPIGLLVAGALLARAETAPRAVRTASVLWVALAASTLVWRARSTSQLTSDPFDPAALLRIGLVSVALLVALVVLFEHRERIRLPGSLQIYGLYVFAALLAAVMSPMPLFAAYRVYELTASIVVAAAIIALRGPRGAGELMLRASLIVIGILVAIAWIEALVVPSQAWESSGGGVYRWTLYGVMPIVPSNALGAYGGLLALWGFACLGARNGQRLAFLAFAGGLATLLATQYRTGLVAFVISAAVISLLRKRWELMTFATAGAILLILFVGLGESLTQTEQAFARGRPELIHTLNSRTIYWHAAKPFILDRPVLGWGLNVESRKVLTSIGLPDTSTVHGTWAEALLGTGFVGALLLALTFLAAMREAWRVRAGPTGAAIVGMLVFFVFRSITGSTVELFSDVLSFVFVSLIVGAHGLAQEDAEEGLRRPLPGAVREGG